MFDLRPLREFRYDLVGAVITDDEALAAIKRIGPAIELAKAASTEVDSPFHALFELSPPTFSVRPRASTFTVEAFHELAGRLAALERHSRRRDATAITDEEIDGLIDDVRGLQIEERSKRALLFQLGVLLRQLGRYRRALDVLDALQLKTADSGYAESRKEQAMNHRRLGEAAQRNGGDPEPEWAAAARLLDDALTVEQLDPDAYGVAGGLAKRRADRALSAGRQSEAEVLLRDAARHYGDGIRAAPSDYYLLLNRATTLRVLGQHFDDHRALDEARLLLPVATYFATRAADADPNDFYAAVSAGELCYTGYAIAQGKGPRWYDGGAVCRALVRGRHGSGRERRRTPRRARSTRLLRTSRRTQRTPGPPAVTGRGRLTRRQATDHPWCGISSLMSRQKTGCGRFTRHKRRFDGSTTRSRRDGEVSKRSGEAGPRRLPVRSGRRPV